MWDEVKNRDQWLRKAVKFTGNHRLYGKYMRRVVKKWPVSCENALTDSVINKRAWVGHAAAALAIGCPEDIVRSAWSRLTEKQRFLANQEADKAIALWESGYKPGTVKEVRSKLLTSGSIKEKVQRYVSVWERRCYSDGLPEEVNSKLMASQRVPSYKSVALAILKNDHGLQSLGLSKPKDELYKQVKKGGFRK